ncbi:adenosine receptor A3-like [Culicoides brevitarsis]|uniref:adenosine receptor A3-like n=1 Tax=Culicoides brevitarsis TaxID=469753 RepID=UPI00307BA3AA
MDTSRIIFVSINSVISVVTITANTFALILFYQQRRSLRKTHAFVVSLGIGDLLQGCVGIPLTIVLCITAPLGSFDCVAICAVRLSICFVSLFNTVTASLERYWAVIHPIHYHTKATGRIIGRTIVLCWIAGWIIGCLCFVFAVEPPNPDLSCFEIRSRYHKGFLMFIVFVAIPFCSLIVIVAYSLIYRQWRKRIKPTMNDMTLTQIFRQSQKMQEIDREQSVILTKDAVSEARRVREIRTTLLMFATVFLFILCWLPWPIILNITRRFYPEMNYAHSAMVCYTFVSLNSMINPFLYVYHIEKWRESAKRVVGWSSQLSETTGSSAKDEK